VQEAGVTASVGSRRHTCPTKRRVLPMIIEPIIPKDHLLWHITTEDQLGAKGGASV